MQTGKNAVVQVFARGRAKFCTIALSPVSDFPWSFKHLRGDCAKVPFYKAEIAKPLCRSGLPQSWRSGTTAALSLLAVRVAPSGAGVCALADGLHGRFQRRKALSTGDPLAGVPRRLTYPRIPLISPTSPSGKLGTASGRICGMWNSHMPLDDAPLRCKRGAERCRCPTANEPLARSIPCNARE